MAQVWPLPADMATAVRPGPRLLVKVGVSESDVPPLPNLPLLPDPQQATEPLSTIAQVWKYPAEIFVLL
jgi:hypothetical protein